MDILGVELNYLPFSEADKKLLEAIDKAETSEIKNFFIYQRAILLQKNKDYKAAMAIYNKFIKMFDDKIYDGYDIDAVYYFRGLAKEALGDKKGASSDKAEAVRMCPKCIFELKLDIVRQP